MTDKTLSTLTAATSMSTSEYLYAVIGGNSRKITLANLLTAGGVGSGTGDALVANPLSQFAATTSAQLAGVITDETGSGALVFATSPTLVTPILGTPTSGNLANCTAFPVAQLSGLGTGVATALGVNVGSAGAFVAFNGALGTPSSGTLTSCTGLPLTTGITGTLGAANGGTGVANNSASTITISGSFALTLTLTNTTGVTLPTTGTLATLAGSEILSGKTLTEPKIADGGFLADANGNELIIFTTTASAVNEWTLANGATGVNPKLTASGEANVGLDFQAKGSGVYRLLGTSTQAAELRLLEDTDDGSNYTAFKVGTQAGNVTYTLPTALGSAGYVLTDAAGNGVLSWAAAGGVPTAITVANEATDTTCFPLFATAATGDLGPKSNAGLIFNSSTGELGSKTLLLAQGTITDPATNLSSTVTWNDVNDTFTAWKVNVTNTASASGSMLMDWQLDGASKISIANVPGTGNFAADVRIKFGTAACLGYVTALGSIVAMNAGCTGYASISASVAFVASAQASNYLSAGDKVYAPDNSWDGTNFGVRVASDALFAFSSTADATGTVDAVIKRGAAKVVSIEAISSAGGTLRFIPTTPAQITANQDNYNPGGSSYFQRWSSDAARDVTGMTFAAAQVDGQTHLIVNVGAQNITLKEQVTSTAANQFMNSTGADIVLAAKQAALAIYDSTTARWRVFKMN